MHPDATVEIIIWLSVFGDLAVCWHLVLVYARKSRGSIGDLFVTTQTIIGKHGGGPRANKWEKNRYKCVSDPPRIIIIEA